MRDNVAESGEAVSKHPFPVDAIVPIASKEEFSLRFDAMETFASTDFATAFGMKSRPLAFHRCPSNHPRRDTSLIYGGFLLLFARRRRQRSADDL